MMKKMLLFAAVFAAMLSCKAAPVQYSDDASGFVYVAEAVPDVILEIRYYSTYNFMGVRVDGYEAPVAMCTREAAAALAKAAEIFASMGYRLKIFDAYRPQKAVDHFVRWSKDAADTLMKRYFYPDFEKPELFKLGYIASRSGHTRGSTFDLTLFDMETEGAVDMGGTFDWFGRLYHSENKNVSPRQYENRMLLRRVMLECGFNPYDGEWWHFTLRNEPYPDTYFTFPLVGNL